MTSKNQSRPSGLLRLTFQQSIFSSSRAKRRASPLHPEHSTCLEANSAAETRKSLFILTDRWLCGLCAVLNGNDSALDKHQQHQGYAVLCRLSDRLNVRPTAVSRPCRSDRSHSPALAAPVIHGEAQQALCGYGGSTTQGHDNGADVRLQALLGFAPVTTLWHQR